VILQTSPELDKATNDNGCYFMSILYHGSQETAQSFSPSDIRKLKKEAVKKGYMREDCYVLDPDGIFELTGLKTQYSDRHESPDYTCSIDEIEILYFRWEEYGHFVAGKMGAVIYDPMGQSNSVQLGTLQSKRIFKVL